MRLALTLAALLAMLPSPARAAADDAVAALADAEARVARVGMALALANRPWCADLAPHPGWLLSDPSLYAPGARDAAQRLYGAPMGDGALPFIAAVAPGGAADRAGLRRGMALRRIGTADLSQPPGPDRFARIALAEAAVASPATGTALEVEDGNGVVHHLSADAACASTLRVEASDRPTAGADGRLILISAALVSFAGDDAELATVIAHELAHNILRHRTQLDDARLPASRRGLTRRQKAMVRATEADADRLSVWLMARAGYDPHAALRFWDRYGTRRGAPLFHAATHARWRDRRAMIASEIAAMTAALGADPAARPPLLGAPATLGQATAAPYLMASADRRTTDRNSP